MTTNTKHTVKNGIKEIKRVNKTKFDPSVELHVNLDLDIKKQDQQIRFSIVLPHGTGKSKKVAVMASGKIEGADLEIKESDLPKIEKGEIKAGRDFDILVAEPKQMPKLAKVAKILGPAGVMPNPKNGTVAEDVSKAVAQIKKGKIEIRTEPNFPIIHTIIGKLSFEENQLEENLTEILNSLRQNKPSKAKPDFIKSVYLSSTMGPSYQLEI